MSVATWSLRERPVCRRAPGVPMSAVRAFSTAMWTSSSFTSQAKAPFEIWPEIFSRPASIAAASSFEIMPCLASILACAREPLMSSCAIALSSSSDAPNSCVKASTPFSNLPPHSAMRAPLDTVPLCLLAYRNSPRKRAGRKAAAGSPRRRHRSRACAGRAESVPSNNVPTAAWSRGPGRETRSWTAGRGW